MSDFTPADMPTGITEVDGKPYMHDAKGGLKPVDLIKPADKLIDEQVRKIFGFALALSDQVARFKGHTFDDLGDLDAMLAQEYGLKIGGAKGNKTYLTHDGLFKIEVRVSDLLTFGPELQVAKGLIDECLNEWAADSRPEIRAIVTRAFNTDKEGQINRSEVFMLLRLEIEDPRWQEAMRAIRDAIRVIGSKTYMRFSKRKAFDAPWETITIDLAKA
ncbi:hypothetical protein RHVG_00016 [Rhodovulum phage RS1]|uniref:DUF3164 family protein n=1 Tax=Rhodobacter phage RC1 TaxID=754055 RepID=UPI0002C18DBA|nr:DUF3164 family protein [Rhodobacter phage RC1]YP_007676395.1 DUF3164 family protein [Rhodovulum phage RS1]AGH57981.1 hypothetical protein RHVG_00016 [Rhodovulum phage RS1]AGH58061.1 hypothetical protein RHWG_00040 [Rhodobacter phage RC1]